MSDEPKLSTVIILTSRMRDLAAFYEKGLGLGPWESFGEDHLGCHAGTVYLGIDRVKPDQVRGPGPVSLWFQVPDVEAAFQKLVSLGAQVRTRPAPAPWGQILASVEDPDGNVLGICGHVEEAQP